MATPALSPSVANDEACLGILAMKFRGTPDGAARQAIAQEYAKTVTKLIESGRWHEMPAPEEQLPDDDEVGDEGEVE